MSVGVRRQDSMVLTAARGRCTLGSRAAASQPALLRMMPPLHTWHAWMALYPNVTCNPLKQLNTAQIYIPQYIRNKIDEEYGKVMMDPNHPLDKELEQLRKWVVTGGLGAFVP